MLNFVDVPDVLPKRITKLAFRNRFTIQEKANIELAAIDDVNGTPEERMQSATLRALLKDIDAANFVDLTREDTISGVTMLETFGVLQPGRAEQILTAPVNQIELA